MSETPGSSVDEEPNYGLDEIQAGLESDETEKIHKALLMAKKVIKSNKLSFETLVTSKIVPSTTKYLNNSGNQSLELIAVDIIRVMLKHKYIQLIDDFGLIPDLLRHTNSNNAGVIDNALRALGYIAASSTTNRDFLINFGFVKILIDLLQANNSECNLLCTILHVTKHIFLYPINKEDHVTQVEPLIKLVSTLVKHENEEVVERAIKVIANIAQGDDDCVDILLETGVFNTFVELLDTCSSDDTIEDILFSYRYILAQGLKVHKNEILFDTGIIDRIPKLLYSTEELVLEETLSILHAFIMDNPSKVDKMFHDGILHHLPHLLRCEGTIQEMTASIIACIFAGDSITNIISLFENYPIAVPYFELLESTNIGVLQYLLDGLDHLFPVIQKINDLKNFQIMFEKIGALSKLQNLTVNENKPIREHSQNIYENWFSFNSTKSIEYKM